jgi:endonuclease/exonuclease/phosphatase family metal-dependent hydrolase
MRFSILAVLLVVLINTSRGQSLKVMTYNIRLDTPFDSVNQWPNRIDNVTALIRKYNPDIIGVQEALHHQLQDLVRVLPDYTYVGAGRDDGKEMGEYSAILFRNSRFGLLKDSTIWLSETGEPGSKGWDAAFSRVATWARIYDRVIKEEFIIINTHFDNVGKLARVASGSLLAGYFDEMFREKSQPLILTGDLNFERTDEAYAAVLEIADGLTDTKPANDLTGTFCGFEVGKMECKAIDYIFHTKEWILKNYQVISDNDGTYYPSDHLPVMVEFELSSVK